VLKPAGKQVIVASGHNIPGERVITELAVDGASVSLSGSPVSPNGIAQHRNPSQDGQSATATPERHEPKLHTVQPDWATPQNLRRSSSTATVITHSQNIR
jgi:hypothetical protein